MEILQTIWTALTTENKTLISIIGIPFFYVELALMTLLAISILNLNISKKRFIIYIIVVPTISNIANLLFSNSIKVIVSLTATPIFAILILKLNLFKGIILEFLPLFIMMIAETIFLNIASFIFGIPIEKFEIIPLYRILMAIINYGCIYAVYALTKRFNISFMLLDNFSGKTRLVLYFNFIIGLVAVISQVYLLSFYSESLPIFITIIGLLSLLAYFFISMYSLSNTSKLAITTTDLEREKETNKRLKEYQDELQAFRHDFSNIMCTISGYIQVDDINGLKKYYSEIQKDINKVNNLGALSPEIINNPAIFILISSKYSRALEENIEMNINVFLDLNTLNMKIYEFTRILGILLDNSIEAAKECTNKIINIEIRKDINRNRQLLLIENTYMDKNIDTEKIFEKKYSTKENNSGLGLWEVRQILKRNKNLNLFTSKNNKYFKQQLEIYN